MSMNWVDALDNLASVGVLDYDAAADLIDKPPRFVGNPEMGSIPPLLPDDVKIKASPNCDIFDTSNNIVQNPSWKKWLFSGISLATIIAIGVGFKRGTSNLKAWGTNTWNYIKSFFTTPAP